MPQNLDLEYLRFALAFFADSERWDKKHDEGFVINYEGIHLTEEMVKGNPTNPIIANYQLLKVVDEHLELSMYHTEATHLEFRSSMSYSYRPANILENSINLTLDEFLLNPLKEKFEKRVNMSFANILSLGEKHYDKYHEHTIKINDNKFEQFASFQTKNGWIELKVDYMTNNIKIRGNYQGVDLDVNDGYFGMLLKDMCVIDVESYQHFQKCEQDSEMYSKIIQNHTIQHIANGFIVDNTFYETLEDYIYEHEEELKQETVEE